MNWLKMGENLCSYSTELLFNKVVLWTRGWCKLLSERVNDSQGIGKNMLREVWHCKRFLQRNVTTGIISQRDWSNKILELFRVEFQHIK